MQDKRKIENRKRAQSIQIAVRLLRWTGHYDLAAELVAAARGEFTPATKLREHDVIPLPAEMPQVVTEDGPLFEENSNEDQ